MIDGKVSSQTRFFAAASATVQSLASLDIPGAGFFVSDQNRSIMAGLSLSLEALNTGIASSIEKGILRGPGLDSRIVRKEQKAVQTFLDKLNSSNPNSYKSLVGEFNSLLNPNGMLEKVAGSVFSTDSAYGRILDGVRSDLGRDIDFAKQSDREAIGNAVIKNVRETGGCDIAGSRLKSC